MLPVGDEQVASVRYRVLAYRPAFEAAGFRFDLRLPWAHGVASIPRPLARAGDLIRDVTARLGEAVAFLHRKTYPPGFASRMRRADRPLIFDFDDAVDLPPPGRAGDEAMLHRYRRNFEATAEAATLAICGNGELARRLPHDRYEILPTPVDTDRFRPGAVAPASGPVAGWVGHSDNLPYLAGLADPLREVARRHPGFRLVVVADRPVEIPGVSIEFRRWRLEDEVRCFDGIAVGLMPLIDSPWARAKCAFKAIQYMALGIPAVASPVGMNREVIRDGESGFLPADDTGWVRALDLIFSDPALAARTGAAGRAVVEKDYALDVASRRLVRSLEGIVGAGR